MRKNSLNDVLDKGFDIGGIEEKMELRSIHDKILYIICPCYNEEENLNNGYTFQKLEGFMGELMEEGLCSRKSKILMVNDGSTDRTAELLGKNIMKIRYSHILIFPEISDISMLC